MSTYRRPRLPGLPIFFTVTLAQRGGSLLVDQIDWLRDAVRVTRAERPFAILAWVVLPDHLHCVWRLPEGDTNYSVRWGAIKSRFTRTLREEADAETRRPGFSPASPPLIPTDFPVVQSGRYAGLRPGLRVAKREQAVWQRRFWGEARPEKGPVDLLQRRTREAPAAKPTISATRLILRRMCGIVGSIR